MSDRSNPHGDDQGTRIGSPDPANAPRRNDAGGATGAGAEAAEGIHGAGSDRDATDRSSVEDSETGSGDDRSGSEPLVDRQDEHRSGYGGAGGHPVRSSDHRERRKSD